VSHNTTAISNMPSAHFGEQELRPPKIVNRVGLDVKILAYQEEITRVELWVTE